MAPLFLPWKGTHWLVDLPDTVSTFRFMVLKGESIETELLKKNRQPGPAFLGEHVGNILTYLRGNAGEWSEVLQSQTINTLLPPEHRSSARANPGTVWRKKSDTPEPPAPVPVPVPVPCDVPRTRDTLLARILTKFFPHRNA